MEGFYVGSIVIDVNDRIGYIKKICNCEKCNERGWFEPEICWIDNPNEYDFISDIEYKNGISKRFKRIGTQSLVNKIEKLDFKSVSPQWDGRDSREMWNKINEIIDYINNK